MLFLFVTLSGCKITQELDNNELLVNRVKIEGIESNELREGSKSLLKQKPNKRLFGFWRFYLRAYNYGMRGDTSKKYRKYIREKIGEPPVILDSTKLAGSTEQIKSYLFNHGYFDAEVQYEIKAKRRSKKATIIYTVKQKQPYTIREIEYAVDDRQLYFLVMQDTANSKIKRGALFNSETISKERDRITEKLRNQGYYFFNKEYIAFLVDSSMEGNYVDISLQVRNPDYFRTHVRYRISNVYVNVVNPVTYDTANTENWRMVDSVWINLNRYWLHENIMLRAVIMRPGDYFSQRDVDNSYARINGVQIFRQSGIGFEKDSVEGYLTCYVNVFPGKRQEFILEPQILTSDQNNAVEQSNLRNYGVANIITYRNKNLFKAAELLEMRYRISLEGQIKQNDSLPFFNNIEHNFTTTLGFPRLIAFKGLERRHDYFNMRSSLVGNFIYESNIDFIRHVLSIGYNEQFNYKIFNTINISLGEISYNRTNAKRNFLELVNPADSIFIANLFTTNLIAGSRITYIYTDRPISRTGSYFFSRVMFESAGLLVNTVLKNTTPRPADGIYKIDNVNVEQFAKIDGDVRYTHVLNELYKVAGRFHAGYGHAYGNSKVMPFVRRYFIGGANSLRGWRPRTLGPGSYNNTLSGVRADRSGEIILELQGEYRFLLIRKLLEGALFLDAGNIWYAHALEGRQGVEFKLGTFWGEMAVNTGFGLRFDFSFFVVRFDFGVPLRNPELPVNSRWLFDDYAKGDRRFFPSIILNLGLDYPF